MVNLTGGGLSGGYRKYLCAVVPRLRAEERVGALDVFAPPAVLDELRATGLGPIETWPVDDARRGFASLTTALRRLRPDVVFVPTARALPRMDAPQVVMVRNMEPLEQPLAGLPLRAALTNVARAFAAWQACRRATRVIAVSHHVADVVSGRLRVPGAKIGVVYHGVGGEGEDAPAPTRATERLRPGSFLFAAGSLRPARGLDDLVDALAWRGATAPPLLVAGDRDADTASYGRRLERRVTAAGLGERVVFAGRLGPAQMRWGFEQCHAFVTTSRAEACPNTALEALHRGSLVVSTDRPPMPEILGEAPLYYRDGDVAGLAAALGGLHDLSAADGEARRASARRRAATFTWERAVRETVDALEAAHRSVLR